MIHPAPISIETKPRRSRHRPSHSARAMLSTCACVTPTPCIAPDCSATRTRVGWHTPHYRNRRCRLALRTVACRDRLPIHCHQPFGDIVQPWHGCEHTCSNTSPLFLQDHSRSNSGDLEAPRCRRWRSLASLSRREPSLDSQSVLRSSSVSVGVVDVESLHEIDGRVRSFHSFTLGLRGAFCTALQNTVSVIRVRSIFSHECSNYGVIKKFYNTPGQYILYYYGCNPDTI